MAFQNPGSPRFYVDIIKYYKAIGMDIQEDMVINKGLSDEQTIENVENGWGNNPYNVKRYPRNLDIDSVKSVERNVHFDKKELDGPEEENSEYISRFEDKNYSIPLLPAQNLSNYINFFGVFNFMPQIQHGVHEVPGWDQNPDIPVCWFNASVSDAGDDYYNINESVILHSATANNKIDIVNNWDDSGFLGSQEIWEKQGLDDGFGLFHFTPNLTENGSIRKLSFFSGNSTISPSPTTEPFGYTRYEDGIGALVVGRYYDLKSPELKLTFTRDYGSVENQKSMMGANFSNVQYSGPPSWGYLPSFTLNNRQYYWDTNTTGWEDYSEYTPIASDNTDQTYRIYPRPFPIKRNGRRSWSLTFSSILDDTLLPAFESLNNLPYGDPNFDESAEWPIPEDNVLSGNPIDIVNYINPLLEDDSFLSQVVLKTLGGNLGFYFLPDSNNTNTDQWAYCKFKRGSFRYQSTGNNTYKLRLSIEEVW